ncbi:MAG: hypothetical protein KKD92_00975 [Proteobacteria bacterium]|nr:hypothetical protein [Pseudomonadota bacterium]
MRWADDFFGKAKVRGILCSVTRRVNGWPETMVLNSNTYYVKSMSYNSDRNLYFQGVDPGKLAQKGDYVLLCGGFNNELVDIFIIPWEVFFETLKQGEPTNTYKPPKEYLQYKFYVRDRSGRWVMTVQGGKRPVIDVTKWRYASSEAIEQLKAN